MSDRSDLPSDDVLAAEYALGVLVGAERVRADRRRRQDPAFASAVEEWEDRLGPMLAAVEPVTAPSGLWNAIDADLSRILRVQTALVPRAESRASDRRVSRLWRWFGLASFGLATASLAMLLVVAQPRPPAEPLTAALSGESGPPLYTAVVYPGATSATLVPVAVGPDPLHAHELWLIGASGEPLSLGVLAQQGTLRVAIPPALLAKGGVLAITREPPGGSPSGKPTGPVVAKGELQSI